MTFRAGCSCEQSQVESWVFMAAGAFDGRALENLIDVTFFAGHRDVLAIQLEG